MNPAPNCIETVYQNVRIEEGIKAIERILVEIYFHEGISTKELARNVLLPVPLVSAVKNEFIKAAIVLQDRGVRLTAAGKSFVEITLGFQGLNLEIYRQLLNEPASVDFEPERAALQKIFEARPQVDVTIDQSKATPMTSLKRAVLALRNQSLIGKRILCAGDDDLVSVALGFLLKKLYPDMDRCRTWVRVLDLDRRFLDYIEEVAKREELPVECHSHDFRDPLPPDMRNQFDCFFTDPPYTITGMRLFLSRGISGLKQGVGRPVFLSFAHKPPDFTLRMQQELLRMGLVISEIIPRFNEYEGAEIIGNTGQMMVLRTSSQTEPVVQTEQSFTEAIYTGELKRTLRTYQCRTCGELIKVGFQGQYTTIEEAKAKKCPQCRNEVFDLVERSVIT